MKSLIVGVILTVLIPISSVYATGDDCVSCEKKLPGTPDQAIPGDLKAIAKFKPKSRQLTKIEKLGWKFCHLYTNSRDIPGDARKAIKDYMLKNNEGEPTLENMINFMNRNKDQLRCGDRNYIKKAVATSSMEAMIYKFLSGELDNDDIYIDFNAVDIIDGKPETVLDYLDKVIAGEGNHSSVYVVEVKKLRNFLADEDDGYSAKKFNELPASVRAKYTTQLAPIRW